MRTLHKGNSPNSLHLAVKDVLVEPSLLDGCVRIVVHNYSVEDLLVQLLEDYEDEFIINKIKTL